MTALLQGKTVCVLDAHGLLYQLFHALPPMTSPQGEPVGAVFGFTRDLFALLDNPCFGGHPPDYLLCCFDMPHLTFRHEIYPEYKANRSAMPDDLRPQIDTAREILEAMGVKALGINGFEADDLMATLARQTAELGGQCILVTSDKDCRQLLNDNVSLFNLRKQNIYNSAQVMTDWGISPEQVVDFQSLVGDSTDNVPGVAGIGAKTAAELLNKFGSLDNIYSNIPKITGKQAEKLRTGKDSAYLSKKLVQLRNDVQVSVDWEHSAYQGYDSEKLRILFQRFGFKTLLKKTQITPDNEPAADKPPAGMLFDNGTVRKRTADTKTYHLIDTKEKFADFFQQLKQQTEFSFDTETVVIAPQFEATMPRYVNIAGMSFAWNDTEAFYLPLRGPRGSQLLDQTEVITALKPILENADIGKIGQNIKYDAVVLRNADVKLQGIIFDTMLADFLLCSGENRHNLDDLAEKYLNHITIKIEELIGSGKHQRNMDEVQTDIMAHYAGEDALVAWKLYKLLAVKLVSTFAKLFYEIELPLASILAEMEYAGIFADKKEFAVLSESFGEKLQQLEKEIYEIAGRSFNIASPKQLAAILFDELGLDSVKKTKSKTTQSTDIDVLEELALLHPLPAKIIEYRSLAKLKGTYVDALPKQIHPDTGRIHTSFSQTTAITGRLSSSNPNLQNIPVRSEEGKKIRAAFKPAKEFDCFLSCDYSQIELRVLAHFSEDKHLCEAFLNNEDIHTSVARQVFGISESENVPPEKRRAAKAVNFGVIYGQSAFGLAKELGIPQKEAQQFIDGYFAKYDSIRTYLNTILDNCITDGYVSTLFGRRRYFRQGTIRSERKGVLNQSERMAVNTVIQGTAADLMKQAMVKLFRRNIFDGRQANLLLQIHDELVFEVKADYAEELKRIVVETMQLEQPLKVPLVVDAEFSDCWR
ncbi:DNA polymerase I [Planctomycetales bacterium]|nr:DNA polymerase I [Planctomycetales bacterium]GHT34029.1 DNA polymerase I [Planctomycetales bacterium]